MTSGLGVPEPPQETDTHVAQEAALASATIPAPAETTSPASPVKPAPAQTSSRIPATRAGRAWIRVFPALVLMAVTLTFVLQNLETAKVRFVTFSGRLPLGVALLVAAGLGAVVMLTLGSVRIVQLRRLVHRSNRVARGNAHDDRS
jgi:uncharacterized integral membrane protein